MAAKNLDELVRDLASANSSVRARAAKRLIALSDRRAIAPLIGLLEHSSSHVRCRVAEVLGELGDSSAYEPLVVLLADPDYEVHSRVVSALGALGDPRALPILLAELEREEQGLQRWIGPDGTTHIYTASFAAAGALARLGRGEAIPSLLTMFASRHVQMRLDAVRTVGELGGAAVFEQLLPMLADDERSVASLAAATLYAIDPERTIATLRAALEDERPGVRRAASELLARAGAVAPPIQRPPSEASGERVRLEEALRPNLLASGELRVRIEIGVVPTPTSPATNVAEGRTLAELLAELQSADVQRRVDAVLSLGRLGVRDAANRSAAIAALREALADEDEGVSTQAAYALAELRDPAALPLLLADLRDSHPETREFAASYLGVLGMPEATAPLIDALGDEAANVRATAAGALGEIGSREALSPLAALRRDDAATSWGDAVAESAREAIEQIRAKTKRRR